MINTIDIFSIKIYKVKYPKIDTLKQRVIPKLTQLLDNPENANFELMRNGGECSYSVFNQLHTWEETKDVVKFILTHVDEYWRILNLHPDLKPYVLNMWANRSTKEGWIYSHNHGPVPIVGTFYLNVSKDLGNIVLENPLDHVLGCQPINIPYTGFDYEAQVNTGDLLLFPGWLKHHSIPNKTDEPRIGISFNIGCTGTYLSAQWVTK